MKGKKMMRIINKIRRYINRLRRRFGKKEKNTKPFFENPSELTFTPFVKANGWRDNSLKLSGNTKAFVSGRFESGN